MNKQEAIERLKALSRMFEEVPTGAIAEAISALEKQIPKKIDSIGNKCHKCGCYLASEPIGDHYCFNCGQAIDWSGKDE